MHMAYQIILSNTSSIRILNNPRTPMNHNNKNTPYFNRKFQPYGSRKKGNRKILESINSRPNSLLHFAPLILHHPFGSAPLITKTNQPSANNILMILSWMPLKSAFYTIPWMTFRTFSHHHFNLYSECILKASSWVKSKDETFFFRSSRKRIYISPFLLHFSRDFKKCLFR